MERLSRSLLIMARLKHTEPIKIVESSHAKHAMKFEVTD